MYNCKLPLVVFFILFISSFNVFAFDYSKAINVAGRQRMLTQKMAKESLLILLRVDTEQNIKNLQDTINLFKSSHHALKNGDSDKGIDAVKVYKIVRQLDNVEKLWLPYAAVLNKIIENKAVGKEELKLISDLNMKLLITIDTAVSLYESQGNKSGTVDSSIVKAINLSGRQRMLSQKMTKEYLFWAYGYMTNDYYKEMGETMLLFENTLNGLIMGDASLGLSSAPNMEIDDQLLKVEKVWKNFSKHLNQEPTDENLKKIQAECMELLREMDKAVQMYEEM